MDSLRRFIMRHTAALLFYACLAALFLIKLVPLWRTCIPGGLEDTRLFLWNAWWFRYAISTLHTNPYFTSLLFHPFGVSLLSHDCPLWNSVATTLLQCWLPLVAACNVTFWLTWTLTGFTTYLLADEVAQSRAAAWVAGLYVMTHSYVLARAMENWGQFNVFGIPLFLWAMHRAHRLKTSGAYALAGIALAATAACHFYFLVYCGLIWMAWIGVDLYHFDLHLPRWRSGWIACWAIAAISGLLAAWIIFTHPPDWQWGRVHIGMESPANPLLVMWVALAIGIGSKLRMLKFRGAIDQKALAPRLRREGIVLGVALLLLLPLLISTVEMSARGDYPKQSILWKTHPAGANLLALFMPNALHVAWGPVMTYWYEIHGMNAQEQAASIGWVCMAIVAMSGIWRKARRWFALAVTVTVFSMGIYLHTADQNLWLPLPFYILRLMPIVGNARIPERWMAVGAVAWSVVLALGLLELAAKKKWPLGRVCAVAGLLVLVENWPGLPIAPLPQDRMVYKRLKESSAQGVLALPFYVGDSSIGAGDSTGAPGWSFPWDHLWAQTFHEKPIAGGYIGRIPRRLIKSYQASPFFKTLIDLEEGKITQLPLESRALGCRAAADFQFDSALVYPASVRPIAWEFVQRALPLEPVAQDPQVALYRIQPAGCP
jgi:hypothetical protein